MNTRFVPRISMPCTQQWSAMSGDDKRRFCAQCQLHVHNLSAMSTTEQEALLSQRTESGRQCIAYIAPDRSIRVRTGTWLLLQRLLRPWRAGLAFVAICLPFLGSGCATTRQESTPPPPPATAENTQSCPTTHDDKDGYWLGGITEYPLWRRILFFWE